MTKLINVYSVAHSQGKTTCALALANVLVANGAQVLVVELDYRKPSVARATGITHDLRNTKEYMQQTQKKGSLDMSPYVLTKSELEKTADREKRELYHELPENLAYLIFPLHYEEEQFPWLIGANDKEIAEASAEAYIQKLMVTFKLSSYAHVIFILPTELESIFGFEVLSHADQIINVVTPSSARIYENRKGKELLFTHAEHVKEKWIDVVNMTSPAIAEKEYREFLCHNEILIPYDEKRQREEIEFRFASELICEKMEQVAKRMGIVLPASPAKKRSRFTWGNT